ncbi:branched-chain amino acid ABC transporter permease [Streptomyces sp. NBC_00464]|uniref:branched-chain amino acid ABC transporter permease n=1 Tax=Streptomyces sp. NBC_00464 TaxID=2975751 RepID=UPI002E199C59
MDVLLAIIGQFGLYGLLTVGIAVIFAATRVVNLAQGDLAMAGAYVAATATGAPFGIRTLLALAAGVPLLLVIERLLLRRPGSDGLAAMLVTWGLGMALRQGAELLFTGTSRTVAVPVDGTLDVLGTPYPAYRLVCALTAIAVITLVLLAAHRTDWGLRLRAVADNPPMAALLGTDPRRMRATAFTVGGLLAILAGALYSPVLAVNPSMGFGLLVPVFFGLLLSRPGSLVTAAVAALLISALSVLLRTWLSDTLAEALFYAVVVATAALRSRPWTGRFSAWFRRTPAPVGAV